VVFRRRWRRPVLRLDWVPVQVLTDDWHQPARQRYRASAGAAFRYGLNDVCPPTSTTVRITDRRARLRSSASRRSPAASPQRSPALAAVAMIARYLSGVTGSSLLRRSSRLMTWSAVSCRRRRGRRIPSQELNAISRLRTADRSTAEVRRCASATVAGDRRRPAR
jgi:hypothetical protein